jgi:hypothetical protein
MGEELMSESEEANGKTVKAAAGGSKGKKGVGKATGPRTPQGKKRSKRNAVKTGIFTHFLLPDEPTEQYDSLLDGLRDDFQPQGTLESVLVERLALLIWRQRRLLRAETAEINQAGSFALLDSVLEQRREAWERSREGVTTGGTLKDLSNPFVVAEAIEILTASRNLLERDGFVSGEDPWRLKKLYGLDHDDGPPTGLFYRYQVYKKFATDPPKEKDSSHSPDKLKKEMIELFNEEIARLKAMWKVLEMKSDVKTDLQKITALVPSQGVVERLVRYEAMLSREFERTLSRLDRCQRIRRGQPVPPTLKVELS